jgi:hypothetical protein
MMKLKQCIFAMLLVMLLAMPPMLFGVDVKISALPAVTTIATSDVIPVVASGVTSKITYANFLLGGGINTGSDGTYGIGWASGGNTSVFNTVVGVWFTPIASKPYFTVNASQYQLATLVGAETLTNKILTAPQIQSQELATNSSGYISTGAMYQGRFSNWGQTGTVVATLPGAGYGLDGVFGFVTATPASYSIAGANTNVIYYNGATVAHGISLSPQIGDFITFFSVKNGTNSWAWICNVGRAASGAVSY